MQESTTQPPTEKVQLETRRLILRAAVDEDAPYLHEVFKNAEAMRYWNEPPHSNLTRTESWLSKMTNSTQNGTTDFIICLKASPSQAIGKMGVWSGDEIGFILHRSQWRKGLAVEALGVLLLHLFGPMGLESITADVDPRNVGSLALLEGQGFEREREVKGTFLVGEEWVDSVYLRLRRERWKGGGGEREDKADELAAVA